MSDIYRIEKATLDDLGAALKEVKNNTESSPVSNISSEIRNLKGTATADKVFAGEEFLGADGKQVGTFSIEAELSETDRLISDIETALASKLG